MAAPQVNGGYSVFSRLLGHRGQVLCIAAPEAKAAEALVATGAEDSTVRLWDLRDGATARTPAGSGTTSSPRVAMCLCRCFGGEAVSSVVFGADGAHHLYCSAGGKVLEFDLRSSGGSRALLMTSPTEVFDDGEEEVNELAVHPKGDYLAAADDSGTVKVYTTRTRRVDKTLRNAHTNICHAVRFRPRTSWDIASGALDSTLVFWDFSTGRVRRKLNLSEGSCVPSASSASSCSPHQLFNPPFVHSVDFTADGCFLAAGLGDSGVVVVDAKNRAPVGRCDGHSSPVSQVHYPSFDPKLLVSAGNDQNLLLWDQRQFEHHSEDSKGNTGDGGGAAGIGSGVSKSRKSRPSGKKKARSKGVNKHQPAEVDGAQRRDNGREHLSGGNIRIEVRPEAEVGSVSPEAGETATEGLRDGIVRCSVPLLSVRLEEKPNWVTSFTVPYAAIAVADTSSVAKILRTHGS
ncbi:unnamed protein product [Ectocarpus sp. 12 AP-2014]